jgi:hypothetical protein
MAANAWAATVKADGLRGQLATLHARIEEEKKGNRGRKAGCGKECERLQNEANALEQRIATVEQASDLSKRIEATQRILDTKLAKAEKTEFKSSSVVNQVSTAGQLYLAFTGAKPEDTLEPDRVTVSYANLIITAGGSLAFMLMAPIGFFIAGRNRREAIEEPMPIATLLPEPNASTEPSSPQYITITDNKAVEVLKAKLRKAVSRPQQLAA